MITLQWWRRFSALWQVPAIGGFGSAERKENQVLLTGFSDADFAGDVDARKSTTGVIFFLADSPITWQSMK
jgi:hypothetical protein